MMHNVAQDLHRPSERVHARGAVSTAVPPRSLLWVTYRIGLCNVDGEMGNMCTLYESEILTLQLYSGSAIVPSGRVFTCGNLTSALSTATCPVFRVSPPRHTPGGDLDPLEHSIDRAVGSYTYIVDACPFVLCTL